MRAMNEKADDLKRIVGCYPTQETNVLEPSCLFAVFLVLVSKILAEAVLFGEDLDEHDGEENNPDKQSLPRPEPDDERGQVGKGTGEHRITVETVRTVGHEVLRARTDLLTESIHGITLAAGFHIDDGPDAEAQAAEHEHAGERGAQGADMYRQIR